MGRGKGMTELELIVLVIIASILAVVAIPVVRGRVDAAKWSEGKAMARAIAKSLRAYAMEKGASGSYGESSPSLTSLGFTRSGFKGEHFSLDNYSWTTSYDSTGDGRLKFVITVFAPTGITTPSQVTVDECGNWIEIP